MNPAILYSLDRIGDLDQLAGSGFQGGVGASGGELQA
jgi:hypothetical protein